MTITLITGANKGIGFETARQLRERGHVVYLAARDVGRGETAAACVGARFVRLDVTDDASVSEALATISAEEGKLDVLVNNAGILADGEIDGPAALHAFDTNAVGIVRVTEAALPLLRKSDDPRVINISSSLGSFGMVTDPARPEHAMRFTLYSATKAAATMLTVQYAKAHPGIRFHAVEPGATATDFTAAYGVGRPVVESARVVVREATWRDGVTGSFRDESGALPW